MLTVVASILLATCCGTSAYPDTGPELEKNADIDAYWCKDTNETQCIVNREIMAQECKTYCEEAFTSVDEFILKYNKTYENEAEAKKRMAIFAEHYVKIKKHNKLYELGKSTYRMGIHRHSDMTYEEFVNKFTGELEKDLDHRKRMYFPPYVPKDLGKEPKYLDYREQGAFNPIREQGNCNSCWAFAAVASIESNLFIKTGKLLQLSERDLVDCDTYRRTAGCGMGGRADWAINRIIEKGIAYRDDYPYTEEDGQCRHVNRINPVAGLKRIAHNESHLLNALVNEGPIVVSMRITSNFIAYTGGVDVDDECPSGRVPNNHVVLLIGYGTDNGTDYWLIRNSWGDDDGDKGYYKMARNVKNDCGISSDGYVTIIKDSPDCEDTIPNCSYLKEYCDYPHINKNCHKTCNTCQNDRVWSETKFACIFSGNNELIYGINFAECKKRCVEETRYECRSVGYWPGGQDQEGGYHPMQCQLSTSSSTSILYREPCIFPFSNEHLFAERLF